MSVSSASHARDDRARFLESLDAHLVDQTLLKLVLARYVGNEEGLERVIIKPVTVKGQARLSFVSRYQTRDITKHHSHEEALALVAELLPNAFRNAHLQTLDGEAQLVFGKKGKAMLTRHQAPQPREKPADSHDREKKRYLDLARPFLSDLGVTDARHELIPSMSRKWKQINKFIEVFSHALAASPIDLALPVRVADFGSGKGYLTFAIHDYLRNTLRAAGEVTGVELRQDMVDLCNAAAARLDHPGLDFRCGDVRSVVPGELEVMIALHACDIATDHAIHTGIRCGASIIMCSPCCHKEIRRQIRSPGLLEPMLQYGLHLGQQAEMLTDAMRALLLEACGYETKVFEFISLEHTDKNKMILAVKRERPTDPAPLLARIAELKAFYAIGEQCLETLLRQDGTIGGQPPAH